MRSIPTRSREVRRDGRMLKSPGMLENLRCEKR
jgi:hypothetical protein